MTTLSSRLRMTEGQVYSVVITLVVAVLLLFGLGNLHGVIGNALATEPLPLAPATAPVATQAPPVAVAGPSAAPLLPGDPVPNPAPAPAPRPTYDDGAPVSVPDFPTAPAAPSARPSPTASTSTCTVAGTQGGYDQAIATLETVNGAAGGGLPAKDLELALGVVTGCNAADPAVVVVGLLIGIGHTLPDPGLANPVVLPFVTIPAPVVAALQPARPAIDQACGLIGTGQTVESLFISAYPQPVPQLVTQALFTALSVCGQVRTP